jgi:F-type H+-transporting ATPase subunit b
VEVNDVAETVFYLASEAGVESVHIDDTENAVTTAHEEHPAEHAAEAGPFAPEPNLWPWTFLAFLAVAYVLYRFAIPKLVEGIDKRNEQIEGDIKKAELTREEADKLLADYKAQLEEARTEAKKVIDEGKALGEKLRQETIAKAQEEANQLITRAQEEIGREKERAIKELQAQIADISIEVASRVIQKSLSKEEHGQIIDDYVAEVGKLYEG